MTAIAQIHNEKACRAVARALICPTRKASLRESGDLSHLTTRFATIQILIDDEINALTKEPSRSHALALILTADFAWQVMRALGDKEKDDNVWFDKHLPKDYMAIDKDIGDHNFSRQKKIIEDAKWVFQLHSCLRHPKKWNEDLQSLLTEPVCGDNCVRLLRAACNISRILVTIQVDLNPTVSVESY